MSAIVAHLQDMIWDHLDTDHRRLLVVMADHGQTIRLIDDLTHHRDHALARLAGAEAGVGVGVGTAGIIHPSQDHAHGLHRRDDGVREVMGIEEGEVLLDGTVLAGVEVGDAGGVRAIAVTAVIVTGQGAGAETGVDGGGD